MERVALFRYEFDVLQIFVPFFIAKVKKDASKWIHPHFCLVYSYFRIRSVR